MTDRDPMKALARELVKVSQDHANGWFVAVLMAERHPDWWEEFRRRFAVVMAEEVLWKGTAQAMAAAADDVAETFAWPPS